MISLEAYMGKPDLLIRTKLCPPFLRSSLVPRARLKAKVEEGLRCPLTLIVAPAGFGKTTLVTTSVLDSGMRTAWLSLDRDDNRTGRFLKYLVAALQQVDPAIGGEVTELIGGIQQPSHDAVLTSLINDIDRTNLDIVLVLDDYQFISDQGVHEEVALLLEHCPSTFHLVIATRSDPPLPLARLRARAQTVELRAADLRFTEEEAAQFLNDVMGLHLDTGLVAKLEERTEGWIAGLQMAALSMRDREDVRGFIEGFSGTNRYILDYLLEEILIGQPPEVQRFLLHTSILGRLTAPLCDALLKACPERSRRDEAGEPSFIFHAERSSLVLDYLDQANLFLVALDDERTWYRYHHLFADLLRARLQQTNPDLVPSLHKKASAWLEQKGLIAEAIQHLLAVHEFGQAADLIERHGPTRLAGGDPSVLYMADSVPLEMLIVRPKIGLYRAWFLIIQGRIGDALPLLKDLEQGLANADMNSGLSWMRAIIASALAFLAPARNAAENPLPHYQILEEIPADELILRNAADFLYGMALARRGELEHAVEVSLKSLERERYSYGQHIPTVTPFLTRIYLMLGRLHAAASMCHEFLDPIPGRRIHFIYTAGSMKIDLGEVLYEWDCLEEAEHHIREGLEANESWHNIMTDGFGLIVLTRLLQAKGDYAGAMQTAAKFEKRLQEHSRPPREFDEDLRTLRVRVQLASGTLKSASNLADQIQSSDDFGLHPELYRLILARIRLAQGRYAEVENLLAGRAPLMTAGSRITKQLESNLVLAAALAAQQRSPEAFELIESSLALAEPEGYLRVFLDVGEPARELLAAYLRLDSPGHKPYAEKILDTFSRTSQASPPAPQQSGLIEPLSGRELEVLQLMALGKTNQEIARQLIISPGTVKAHTASIYRKLEVANRTEAVVHARQLGILL